MDYLVFGVGCGASFVLIGWLFQQFGPAYGARKSAGQSDLLSAEEMIARHEWAGFTRAVGLALMASGLVMLLGTAITLLIRPSDSTGSTIVGILFVLALIAVAVWIGLFVRQSARLDLGSIVGKARSGRAATATDDLFETDEDIHDDIVTREEEPAPRDDAVITRKAAPAQRPAPRPISAESRRMAAGLTAPARKPDTTSTPGEATPRQNIGAPATQPTAGASGGMIRYSRPARPTTSQPRGTTSSSETTPAERRSRPAQPTSARASRPSAPVTGPSPVEADLDEPRAPRTERAPQTSSDATPASPQLVRPIALDRLRLRRAERPSDEDPS